ncbi:MAG: hypothetical protein JXA93_19380 [Anaerolineae bacterium]|nr:hypothetical protein [Anaerolineae bacterium]
MSPSVHFAADRTAIQPGECTTIRWHVEGVKEVYFFAEGQGWEGHGVVGVGEQQVCPQQTTTYRLRVVQRDGSKDVHKMTIHVQPQAAPQVVQMFTVDRAEIQPGECVTFRWHVEGVKAVYFHPEGQRWQDHGVAGVAEQQVCPQQTTTYYLRVIRRDDSVEEHKITVQVRSQARSRVVQTFSLDRVEIRPGECATFRWHVEGVKAVYFHPEREGWQDHGVAGVAEQQVCPTQTTSYCLRVIHRDDAVENHYLTLQVR